MSERHGQRRRRRRRRSRHAAPPVIEEGGEEEAASAGVEEKPRPERRRGARVQKAGDAKPNTILGMPRMLFFISAGLFAVIIATTVAGRLFDTTTEIEGVVPFPDQGRRHLQAGETFALSDYNSFPPTSGPQAVEGATPGIYRREAEDEAFRETPDFAALLPLLERGGVVIYYDPARIAGEALSALEAFVATARDTGRGLLTLVELDEGLEAEAPVVATAWRHLLPIEILDEAGQEAVGGFAAPSPEGFYLRFVLDPSGLVSALPAAD